MTRLRQMLMILVLVAGLFTLQAVWLAVWMRWGWTEFWPSCSENGFHLLRGNMRPEFLVALYEEYEFYYRDAELHTTGNGRLLVRPAIRYLHVDFFPKYTSGAIIEIRDAGPGPLYVGSDECAVVAAYAFGPGAPYRSEKYHVTLRSLYELIGDSDRDVFDVFSDRMGHRKSDAARPSARAGVPSNPQAVGDRNAPHAKSSGPLPRYPLPLSYPTDTRIYFDKGAATPLPASRSRVDRIAASLRQWPDLAFIVWGHADPEEVASEEAALKLGLQRAVAVRDLLVERGVARQALAVSSRGYSAFVPLDRKEQTLSALRYATVQQLISK